MSHKKALVVGASGIAGSNLARALIAQGWEVAGLARRPGNGIPGVIPVAADLLDEAGLAAALADENRHRRDADSRSAAQ